MGVTFLVAWLLENAIYSPMFVGIPAGIVCAGVVAVGCVLAFGRTKVPWPVGPPTE